MASRRKGRILAFQALYSWEVNGGGSPREPRLPGKFRVPEQPRLPGEVSEDLLKFSWLELEKQNTLDEDMSGFSRLLIIGTVENIAAIDQMIKKHLENWDFSRLNRVDLAILRMSTYTLMFQTDVAPSIVINEAIGISKEFGTGESYRFINGVLDSIKRTLQKDPAPPEALQGVK
ncbi:MAG: transcription antitermination factor NusB [Treponema sp.]|jgi:N utilization substance protein B|nr:transcription antitermination factor NusB [Treponema sp.]